MSHYNLEDRFISSLAIAISLIIAIMVAVIEYSPPANASELLESNCQGGNSFYLPTQLYQEEARIFSENAKAFSFVSTKGDWMRIITDYQKPKDNYVYYSLLFKPIGQNRIDYSNTKISLNFNDGTVQNLLEDSNVNESMGIISVRGEREIEKDISAELIIKTKSGNCQGKIPNSLMISTDTKSKVNTQQSTVIKGNQSGEYFFAHGYTPIGFSSWRYLKPFTDKGLTILKYDQSSKEWILNPQNQNYFAEPGIGYLVYNPNNYSIKIKLDAPFFVPFTVSDHRVTRGWNLLYNDTGNDVFAKDISLTMATPMQLSRIYYENKITLEEMIKAGKADRTILFPKGFNSRNEDYEKVNLSEKDYKQVIPDASVFWVYIYDDIPTQNPKTIDFSTDLSGGGDSFEKNEIIQFEIKITNQNTTSVLLPDSSQYDPCLIGLEFYASSKKIESDFDKKECPLWPKLSVLEPGSTFTYNYSWNPPDNISGEIKVRSYFDYTRMGASDMLYNEVKLNIK